MLNSEEFVNKCEKVYMAHKEELESKHSGKIVALYEEGIAAIGEDTDSVYREAIKTHPGKIFYLRRIGKFSASGILV
jgi:hypothetical protein